MKQLNSIYLFYDSSILAGSEISQLSIPVLIPQQTLLS